MERRIQSGKRAGFTIMELMVSMAIVLVVLTALAFAGILAGLAMGRIEVAGLSGLVLVLLWFGVLGVRGRR